MLDQLSSITRQWAVPGLLLLLSLLPTGCKKTTSTPHPSSSQPASSAPTEGLHRLIGPGDGPEAIIERLGEPEQRGRWAGGETLLYFRKGMQVNFRQGVVLSLSLYDGGVALKPGAPAFKKYNGSIDGISLDSTVREVSQAWGEPTRAYSHGQPGKQEIVLDYEDRHASLTVWPPVQPASSNDKTFQFPSSGDVNAQSLRSITLYWASPDKNK